MESGACCLAVRLMILSLDRGGACDVLPSDSQFGNRISLHLNDQTENTQTGSGKILLPFDQIIENMIRLKVIPHWNVKNNSPIPDEMLFEALGGPDVSGAVIARLEVAIPDRYRSAVKALQLEIDKWRRKLSDPTLTPLENWNRSYTAAIVERRFAAREGQSD